MGRSQTHFQGNHLYPLEEILFLSIAAFISDAETWTFISLFRKAKLEWLKKFFPFENGIPSMMCLEKCLHPLIRLNSVNVLFLGLILWQR
ncbi:transposase family protein [Algoriphagus boritolerans]|uniref:transposase family protein n=1 Tax=Algoriphagus boritolerans TaxID=308111 RepID=UPI003A10096C